MIFGFLGFGKMASALVEGMLKAGSCKSEEILVINRHPETVQQEIVKLGIQLAPTTQVMVERSDVIVLGTKPADSLQLLREVRPALDGIGQGATAYATGDHATPQDAQVAEKIFSSVGIVYKVREGALDAVTGLSGSGPAYVFTFVEALADGGVMMGLPRDVALDLAVQTVCGSAQMIRQTNRHPAELREMVASPGGTTMAALEILEARGFRYTVMSAVRAASERAQQLGRG